MKTAYRALAALIALGVVVQAASIAYASFALAHAVDAGATVDESSTFGEAGFELHGINGEMVIPLLAILLFVVSFSAHIRQGTRWAAYVLLATAVQVVLGLASGSVPALGWLHGITAFVLFALAGYTSQVAARASTTSADPAPFSGTQV